MGTTVAREEALLKYAWAMLLISRKKKKHLRLPQSVIQYVQKIITPVWGDLTEAQRMAFMFVLNERRELGTVHSGPVWKIVMATWWLKDKAADLAARFLVAENQRLN